jgi:hypothetical protein
MGMAFSSSAHYFSSSVVFLTLSMTHSLFLLGTSWKTFSSLHCCLSYPEDFLGCVTTVAVVFMFIRKLQGTMSLLSGRNNEVFHILGNIY